MAAPCMCGPDGRQARLWIWRHSSAGTRARLRWPSAREANSWYWTRRIASASLSDQILSTFLRVEPFSGEGVPCHCCSPKRMSSDPDDADGDGGWWKSRSADLARGRRLCIRGGACIIPEESNLHYMAAADRSGGYMGLKIYTIGRGERAIHGAAVQGANRRMAGADRSGLSRADAHGRGQRSGGTSNGARGCSPLGIIGTGLQARTQMEAVAQAQNLSGIRVFGRDKSVARNSRRK